MGFSGRIKKLEEKIGKEAKIYILEKQDNGIYKYFNEELEGSFTEEEVEDLKEQENNLVLIVSWKGNKTKV